MKINRLTIGMITEQEAKKYHLKKILELSIKSIGEKLQSGEPTDEQKEWVLHRLEGTASTWKKWFEK